VSRITNLFLDELKHAWEAVLPLKLAVERVESNPQLVQIVPPNEVVVLISFEITLGEVRGMMNLCIPFNSIERIGNKLTTNNWMSYARTGVSQATKNLLSKQLDGSLVELVVTLAETTITTSDLLELRVGDIITTDKDRKTTLEVAIQGLTKYHASPGALKGRKAIQIEEIVAATPVPPKK
jgi:flagellar motor switch protein FliM